MLSLRPKRVENKKLGVAINNSNHAPSEPSGHIRSPCRHHLYMPHYTGTGTHKQCNSQHKSHNSWSHNGNHKVPTAVTAQWHKGNEDHIMAIPALWPLAWPLPTHQWGSIPGSCKRTIINCHTSVALRCRCHTSVTLPCSYHTSVALPCRCHTSKALPCNCHTSVALPCNCHTSVALPCNCHTSVALPCNCHTWVALPCNCHTSVALPCNCHTSVALPWADATPQWPCHGQMPHLSGLALQLPHFSGLALQLPHLSGLALHLPHLSGLALQPPHLGDLAQQLPHLSSLDLQLPTHYCTLFLSFLFCFACRYCYLFTMHVWHPCFPWNGTKKHLTCHTSVALPCNCHTSVVLLYKCHEGTIHNAAGSVSCSRNCQLSVAFF